MESKGIRQIAKNREATHEYFVLEDFDGLESAYCVFNLVLAVHGDDETDVFRSESHVKGDA